LLAAMPYMKVAFDLLPYGQFIGDVTDRDQLFYEIVYPAIMDAEQGNITVDEALAKINQEANAMVDAATK
jgi:multiple sugar transport system substrate-binding protein